MKYDIWNIKYFEYWSNISKAYLQGFTSDYVMC